jgi:uncharacterized protein
MSDTYRGSVADHLLTLQTRLTEPPPGRIQLLVGPRQVGKTRLLLTLQAQFGHGAQYHAADAPEASLPGWWDRIWADAERLARAGERVVILLDEVQHLPDWATLLKGQWDRLQRLGLPVHIVATGSSALRVATGSRETLAGRFERLEVGHWTAAALVRELAVPEAEAVRMIVERGSYPGAVPYLSDPRRWSAYVRESIVEPALGHDLAAIGGIRRPALLRQVFALAVTHPAQIVPLQKLQGQLQDRGALETIASYLGLLEEAWLVASLERFGDRPTKRRSAPPKLLPLTNALCAVADWRGVPDRRMDPERYGAWVEAACLAHAWNGGRGVSYWREEPLEVDAVLEALQLAIEVKTGPFSGADLRGLLEFCSRHRGFRPLVLCDAQHVAAAQRLGVDARSWDQWLLDAPP